MAIINGTSGNDTLIGSNGNEVVNDTLYGFGGNDLLDGRFGFDLLDGGTGIDTADYSFYSKGIVASLQTGVVSFPGDSTLTDTLAGIENVIGSSGNDSLTGNQANNAFNSGTGNDTLNGGTGNDTLNGGDNDDTLYGGAGNDLLDGGFGFDLLDGGVGIDTADYSFYSGGIVANLQTGVVSFPGASTLTDTLVGTENIIGSSGNDSLIGNQVNNTLNGGIGNDNLNGGKGNDSLIGGTGNDTLTGVGVGFGRGEIDTLTGGLGADRFILGEQGNVYYNDGDTTGSPEIGADIFGLTRRSSDTGWRIVDRGNRFHFGIDYGSGGVARDFLAGVNGTVTRAGGGLNNTIDVRLANGNLIQYLHASSVNVKNKQVVTPNTVLGKTGRSGTDVIHLHIQAKNANDRFIDTDAALAGNGTGATRPLREWRHGMNDYAVIKDFVANQQDVIQLAGRQSQYQLLPLRRPINSTEYYDSIVDIAPLPVGTAILYDDDGEAEFKGAELVGILENTVLTALNSTNFNFLG